jgi:hypothetical protein
VVQVSGLTNKNLQNINDKHPRMELVFTAKSTVASKGQHFSGTSSIASPMHFDTTAKQ